MEKKKPLTSDDRYTDVQSVKPTIKNEKLTDTTSDKTVQQPEVWFDQSVLERKNSI